MVIFINLYVLVEYVFLWMEIVLGLKNCMMSLFVCVMYVFCLGSLVMIVQWFLELVLSLRVDGLMFIIDFEIEFGVDVEVNFESVFDNVG